MAVRTKKDGVESTIDTKKENSVDYINDVKNTIIIAVTDERPLTEKESVLIGTFIQLGYEADVKDPTEKAKLVKASSWLAIVLSEATYISDDTMRFALQSVFAGDTETDPFVLIRDAERFYLEERDLEIRTKVREAVLAEQHTVQLEQVEVTGSESLISDLKEEVKEEVIVEESSLTSARKEATDAGTAFADLVKNNNTPSGGGGYDDTNYVGIGLGVVALGVAAWAGYCYFSGDDGQDTIIIE